MKISKTILISFTACALCMSNMLYAQNNSGRSQILFDAAEALGGLEAINAVENITLIGYGQRLYQYGGGGITASKDAPLKWQAVNDLRRVYDIENTRYQQLERRNFLFPFASSFGHNFALNNQVLDGEIAYDIRGESGNEQYSRQPEWNTNILTVDGAHMRRMWMMNNPIVALRTAMNESATLTNLRTIDDVDALDVTLPEGDEFTLAFNKDTHLPVWVSWASPHVNLGQIQLTTYFTGYAPFDDVLLPLGYNTKIDWRDHDFFKIYVDNYLINDDIADLQAPTNVRNSPSIEEFSTPEITTVLVGDGVWRLSTGTIVFEFSDHLTLFELGDPDGTAVIEAARRLVPGKPVTEVIISHAHFDHVRGIRDAVSEGLTVIGRRNNEGIIQEMVDRDAADYPDPLELNPMPLKYIPVDEHLRLQDSQMIVDVYWGRANTHMADAVFAHVPEQAIFVEGDMATAAEQWQFWGDNYLDNIEYYDLEVEFIAPVHMPVMTHEAVVQMVGEGVQRARELCAAELAKGNYFAGCPIQSKRF